jgi:hypothetical protein
MPLSERALAEAVGDAAVALVHGPQVHRPQHLDIARSTSLSQR